MRARQEDSTSLSMVQPVIRSEADMEISKPVANGNSGHHEEGDSIPSPERKKSEQAERAPSQQNSTINMNDHPTNEPHPLEDNATRNSPRRASVRVRAPPGGQSSGGFW